MGKATTVSKLCSIAGVNMEATDENGLTPLHLAASCAHPIHDLKKGLVQILIEAGANANAKDNHGQTPIERAREFLESRTWSTREEATIQEEIKRLESV